MCNVDLYVEEIFDRELEIVRFRPDWLFLFNIDELRGYPNPVGGPSRTSLEHIIDIELLPDVTNTSLPVREAQNRRPGDNDQ